jgi:hypothetical protein
MACQKQHWTSHKSQCRSLAFDELRSIFKCHNRSDIDRIVQAPDPSELSLLRKLSGITWTVRPNNCKVHIVSLITRGKLLDEGRPVPGDTKGMLIRLVKRATTELPWPELPGKTKEMFFMHLRALALISRYGEPEASVEILSRHVEDVEKGVVAPNYLAAYFINRLDWLLAAAVKFKHEKDKRSAYVAEAKGLMERATRSLRGLRPEDWDGRDKLVSGLNHYLDHSSALKYG